MRAALLLNSLVEDGSEQHRWPSPRLAALGNMASKTTPTPHLVAVDASALPQTPEEVARLRPDKRVAVSFGCEERCAVQSRKEDVTLGDFCATLRNDPRAGYLKQCPLEDLGCRWSLRAHAPFLTSWVQETAFLWVGGADATTGLHLSLIHI